MSKRKLDSPAQHERAQPNKRPKVTPPTEAGRSEEGPLAKTPALHAAVVDDGASTSASAGTDTVRSKGKRVRANDGGAIKDATRPAHKVRKLVPPRPFPTVPTSVSATGPRSAHTEGKNHICITRRTELGAYLRRCKDVFLKDGCALIIYPAFPMFLTMLDRYKTLHLSAMGAAIPHLMQLALSLPAILPFPQDEIRTEILTGTVEVQDELVPEDEDEDISYRTRGKSSVSIIIKIGDGVDEPAAGAAKGSARKNQLGRVPATAQGGVRKGAQAPPEQLVYRADEMDET